MKRYQLAANQYAGKWVHELEEVEDGKWVEYEEVKTLEIELTADKLVLVTVQNAYKKRLEELKQNNKDLEKKFHTLETMAIALDKSNDKRGIQIEELEKEIKKLKKPPNTPQAKTKKTK